MLCRPDNKAQLIQHPPTPMASSLLSWRPQCHNAISSHPICTSISLLDGSLLRRPRTWRGSSRCISIAFERRVNTEFADSVVRRSPTRSRSERKFLVQRGGFRLKSYVLRAKYSDNDRAKKLRLVQATWRNAVRDGIVEEGTRRMLIAKYMFVSSL